MIYLYIVFVENLFIMKIYINVQNGKFRPMYGQNEYLDKHWDEDINENALTKKSRELIKKLRNDMYVSENFSFDPTTLIFNFEEIHPFAEEDFDEFNTYKFDASVKYEATPINDNTEQQNDKESDNNESIINETIIDKTPKKQKETKKVKPQVVTVTTNILKDIKKNYKCPDIEDGFYVNKKIWNYLIRNILKKKNTLLLGPTGTGKTDIVIRIAKLLNIELNIYDMGAMIDPLTDLLGTHRIKDGNSVFDYSKFVTDVQKPGIILLDELSRAPLMTNNILFPCLDHRRTLNIEIAGSTDVRAVKVHPDCVFIATANIGQEYSGTNDIDAALMNRFNAIQVEYLPQEIESKILNVRTGVDIEIANKILNVANAIRNAYLMKTISKPISTRETLECAELIVDGFTLKDSINLIFCQKFSKTDGDEYSVVKNLIMGF